MNTDERSEPILSRLAVIEKRQRDGLPPLSGDHEYLIATTRRVVEEQIAVERKVSQIVATIDQIVDQVAKAV